MKVQRDLTTILYILVSGIYLIVGARSFARAPDTPETGYFYLIGLITWVVATLVWMQQSQIQASSTSDTKNSGEETLGSHRAARISYLMSIGFMSICSVDATFSSAEGTLSSRILPICQFVSAIITPCLFLHCFLIFPVEKKFIQRHTWMLKALYLPGIALCLLTSIFYLRGHDYTREFFMIQLSPLETSPPDFFLFIRLLVSCYSYIPVSPHRPPPNAVKRDGCCLELLRGHSPKLFSRQFHGLGRSRFPTSASRLTRCALSQFAMSSRLFGTG